jgi:alpha-N-arabinofuranosidase
LLVSETKAKVKRLLPAIIRTLWLSTVLTAYLMTVPATTNIPAQSLGPLKAELVIRADLPQGTINRNIYGQFAEHLGRGIYDGLWVGENSAIPNTRGLRNDVVAALKRLNVPVIRWPGGCFADEYHWRDGIGPSETRPRRVNASWGGVETNAFGTHEFMDLCEMIGADAYVAGNVGSATPQEMMEWVEYMTSDADSTLANLRRRNGREKPWRLAHFAVGNEPWGCGGNMRADYYADEYRRFSTFIKNYSGNRVGRYASGGIDTDYKWTETMLARAAQQMEGYSLHYYTLPTSNWEHKGSATEFGETEWHATLARTLRMDELIRNHSEVMDRYDPQKRIGLIVDEWGTWYDPTPGPDRGALYQQNSLRDAVVAGLNLNIFNRHSDRVQMANIAQMVNVLQAMILTEHERMLLTPTYYVFEMYKVHQGATLIPVEWSSAPEYRFGQAALPALDASASRDRAGRLHLTIVNLDPNRPAQVSMRVAGAAPKAITGRQLTAPAMNSINTFDRADVVRPAQFTGIRRQGDVITLELPSKSIVVLEF